MILNLTELPLVDRQHYLQHVVAPRPICFASTIDPEGRVNLSPFSFLIYFPAIRPSLSFPRPGG